jgi:hypothetical protein
MPRGCSQTAPLKSAGHLGCELSVTAGPGLVEEGLTSLMTQTEELSSRKIPLHLKSQDFGQVWGRMERRGEFISVYLFITILGMDSGP